MENIKEQFKRLFCELDLTDDQAAMIKKLQRDVDAVLRQTPVIGSVCSCDNVHGEIETKTNYCWYCLKQITFSGFAFGRVSEHKVSIYYQISIDALSFKSARQPA